MAHHLRSGLKAAPDGQGQAHRQVTTNIVSNQCLPLRVVIDKCLNMSLQEIGCNRHLKSSTVTASYENRVKIDLHLHVILLAPSIMPRIFFFSRKINKLIYLF